MSVYTKVGSLIWLWPPFRRLERGPDDIVGRCAKLLWLALYTCPEAKQSVPGLFSGSINTMAEATGFPPDEIRRYLDRLVEDDLVEFDIEHRVLRMLVLPDAGESPSNGNTIRGWWRKFQNVAPCTVRDSHVPMLMWLMQEWSRFQDKPITPDHMKAWVETFGRISVPAARPRAPKHVQTSLFASSPASDLVSNEIRYSETVSKGFRNPREKGSGEGSGSGSPDPKQGGSVGWLVDQLSDQLENCCGGTWKLPETAPERAWLLREMATLPGLDLALLGSWMAFLGLSRVNVAREIMTQPGRLTWAMDAAHRWRSDQDDRDRRAAVKSAELRETLAQAGMSDLAGAPR